MDLNKRGQTLFVALMIGIVLVLLALAFAFPLNQVITNSRVDLNCSNTTLTYQGDANCVAVDSLNWLWIGTLLGFAGIVLARVFL